MLEQLKSKLWMRIFAIVSGLALVGFMVLPMLDMLKGGNTSQTQSGGNSSAEAQQLKQIAEGYEVVVKKEPNNVAALQGLAEARLKLQDFPAAIEPVKKLHNLDPANIQYIGVLAQLYQVTNNASGASELQQQVEKLSKSDPKNPQYIAILTELYRQTNNSSGAKELENRIENLVKAEPKNPQYLQILAQLRLQKNDLLGALEIMKKLQGIYPEDEKLTMAISKIEEAIAQQNQAVPIPIPTPQNNQAVPIPIPSPQNNQAVPIPIPSPQNNQAVPIPIPSPQNNQN